MILNWFSPDCKKSTVYVDVKNFLWHLWTCSGYIKTSSEAGEHSAFWIRDVRHIKRTSRFKVDNYGFFQIRAKSKQNRIRNFHLSAFSEGVCWLYVNEKISMALMNMFWVCKGFLRRRGTQRIWISDVRHKEKKRRASIRTTMTFLKSSQKCSSLSVFWGCLLTLRRWKKFLWHLWTCSGYVKVPS